MSLLGAVRTGHGGLNRRIFASRAAYQILTCSNHEGVRPFLRRHGPSLHLGVNFFRLKSQVRLRSEELGQRIAVLGLYFLLRRQRNLRLHLNLLFDTKLALKLLYGSLPDTLIQVSLLL